MRVTTSMVATVVVVGLLAFAPTEVAGAAPSESSDGPLDIAVQGLVVADADGVSSRSGVGSRVVPVGRVAGEGRLETAVAIANRSFPDGAGVAYVARADALADALAAGTLTDGPILLVPSCGPVPAVVAAEVDRLDPDVVVGLGGNAAVCGDMLTGVAGGREVDRIAGQDRFDTAIRVAQRGFGDGAGSVYVANGADSPDAVAGGALTDGPILLVPPGGGVLPTVAEEVARIGPERVVALGGTGVVSDGQLGAAAGGIATGRLSGVNRFATSVAIAVEEFGDRPPVVYLARGDVFADAVASGSLTDGPVVLVPACGGLPAEVVEYLGGVATSQVIALGGQAAICDEILNAAAALPTLDEDPAPPPPPGPGEPDDLGTLYYSEYGELMAIDMTTLGPRQLLHTFGTLNTFGVAIGAREFTHIEENRSTGEHLLRIRDLDDTSLVQTFPWGIQDPDEFVNPRGVSNPEPSPDGELHIAQAEYHAVSGGTISFIEVMDRDGENVARVEGGRFYFSDDGAFSDWTWTPDGDLLAVVHEDSTSDVTDAEAAIILIDGDTLADGDADLDLVVLAEFSDPGVRPGRSTVSPDGSQLAYSYDGDVWVMPFQPGADAHRLASGAYPLMWPTFSPSGEELVMRKVLSSGTPISPSSEETHVIPNHRGPTIDIELGGPTELRVQHPSGSGEPATVRAKGPYYWGSE